MMDNEDAKKFWKQMESLEAQNKKIKQHNDGLKHSLLRTNRSFKKTQFVDTLVYPSMKDYKFVRDNLAQLKQDLTTFDQLKIPEFAVELDPKNLEIKIIKQFIRGKPVTNDRKWSEIIWREVVERPQTHSFSSLHYHNFLYDSHDNLYYVDLDDYKPMDHEDRIARFLKHFTR